MKQFFYRLSRSDETELDLVQAAPLVERFTGELRTILTEDSFWFPPTIHQTLQCSGNCQFTDVQIHFQPQAFSGAFIYDVQKRRP